jgi:hypothetical protein
VVSSRKGKEQLPRHCMDERMAIFHAESARQPKRHFLQGRQKGQTLSVSINALASVLSRLNALLSLLQLSQHHGNMSTRSWSRRGSPETHIQYYVHMYALQYLLYRNTYIQTYVHTTQVPATNCSRGFLFLNLLSPPALGLLEQTVERRA